MSAILRRIKKRAPTAQLRARKLKRHREAMQFEGQRRVLFDRLRNLANECSELDPVRFLIFLRQQRRGYSAATDGPSVAMQLVDDIDALDELEREWAST